MRFWILLSIPMKYALVFVVVALALTVRAEEPGNAESNREIERRVTLFAQETTFTSELGMKMIWVPPGKFRMGNLTGKNLPTEKPVRTVELSGYYLGATEVTQAHWEALMDSNPSRLKGDTKPVDDVSWEDAMAFCRKLTKMEREAGRLPEGYEYTLPTEAQWEHACRAGTEGDYAGDLNAMAWYSKNSGGKPHPVATKKPNAWGFFDMHGNVVECCLDWFAIKYDANDTRDPQGPVEGTRDPRGLSEGPDRVNRGGGYYFTAGRCYSSSRITFSSGYRRHLGFRPCLSLTSRVPQTP